MAWKPAPSELIEFIDSAIVAFDCQRKKMFGYPAYFVNGNMFAGLFEDKIIVRLSPEDRELILAGSEEAIRFEPMPGRPMKEYVVLLEPVFRDPKRMNEWLGRSFQYTSSLQPKEPRGKGKR